MMVSVICLLERIRLSLCSLMIMGIGGVKPYRKRLCVPWRFSEGANIKLGVGRSGQTVFYIQSQQRSLSPL